MPLTFRTAPLAVIFAAFLTLSACNGDSESALDGGSETPAGATSPPAGQTTQPSGDGCIPGDGPPAQGSGPAELTGRIAYVRLVFGCQPDVYIMDANGNNARPLANDPALDDESDLSPDGSKVVFFSGRDGTARIYVMNSDGSDQRPITDGAGGDTSPRWSPDGARIAFSRGGSLAVMNADGSDARIIMQSQPAESAEPCRAGSFVGAWSPDGQRIVYYSAIIRSDGQNTFWICIINADGSDIQLVVGEPAGRLHAEPHWSPDGKKIVFRDDRDGGCEQTTGTCNYEIYVLDLESGQQTNVTNHPSLDIEPAWSPDSQWIVFSSNREDPNFDLYVIRSDGTGLTRLLNDGDSKDSYPSWR
jgi:Tol biopolymer transport system component